MPANPYYTRLCEYEIKLHASNPNSLIIRNSTKIGKINLYESLLHFDHNQDNFRHVAFFHNLNPFLFPGVSKACIDYMRYISSELRHRKRSKKTPQNRIYDCAQALITRDAQIGLQKASPRTHTHG